MGVGKFELPAGTVTFLFTDIEGSTQLLQANPEDYEGLLVRHREILEQAIERHGGRLVDRAGDSCFAAFGRAADAILAAVDGQRSLKQEHWAGGPLRVRMGLHTGEPTVGAGGYVGIDVHRVARIAAAAHGGQILCSRATYELAGTGLPAGVVVEDLGDHRLKDLRAPQRIYQLRNDSEGAQFPPLRSLEGHQHNLPFQVNEIIGREQESGEIRDLLQANRLVTLVGPGGIGKTRLALEVAATVVERFESGVWCVELSSLSDPDLLAQTIAGVLGVREQSVSSIELMLLEYLRQKELLLVLDNCEHLLDACAGLSTRLLAACGGVRILATSREAYSIPGEWVRRVPSLALPSGDSSDVAGIGRSEAVRLFVERARALSQSFQLTSRNAGALAEICRRLDGIPLAIELAASRTKVLSVEEIARRLDDRFRLLTGGSRAALPRQQTLKALIDWSYELLSDNERCMLRRLSVFCCSWTLEGAEQVCAGEDVGSEEVLDLVTALIDKSLVFPEREGGETRYRLLETIRHYAREKLLEQGESRRVRDLHLQYFLNRANEADSELRGSSQEHWLGMMSRQDDEFRGALDWALTNGEVRRLKRLAAALWRYWRMRSLFSEGRRWLEAASQLADPEGGGDRSAAPERAEVEPAAAGAEGDPAAPKREDELLTARCLIGAGSLANYQGDYERATELLSGALTLCQRLHDPLGTANSLNILAHARMMTGNLDGAEEMLTESIGIFTELGDRRGIAYGKYFLGTLYGARGQNEAALELLEEGLSLMEELGDSWWIENALLELGWVNSRMGAHERALEALERALAIGQRFKDRRGTARAIMHKAAVKLAVGEVEEAGRGYRESLLSFFEIGDKWGAASCIEGVAAVAAHEQKRERAALLLGATAGIRESLKASALAVQQRDHKDLVSTVSRSLGRRTFERLFADGKALSFPDAAERALGPDV